MTPTNWLVQSNVSLTSPTSAQIELACKLTNRSFHSIIHPPGRIAMLQVPETTKSCPLVFHGRSALILSALNSEWRHGVFFEPENFTHSAYARGYTDDYLNVDAQLMSWEELLEFDDHNDSAVFLKPINDYKGFTGLRVRRSEIASFYKDLTKSRPMPLQDLVVVAQPKNIINEWRFFIVDGVPISASMYVPKISDIVPVEVWDFATQLARIWQPAVVYTLDIAKTDFGFKIVECNCFNASRFYLADIEKLVRVISEFQESTYPQNLSRYGAGES